MVLAGLALVGLLSLVLPLVLRTEAIEPFAVDVRPWLQDTPFARFAPNGPSVLQGESLEAARGALAVLAVVMALWMVWLRVRVFRIESRLAETLDREDLESRELESLRARFRELIETAQEFTYRHDLDGRSLWLDPNGLRALGYDEGSLATLTLADLLEEDSTGVVERQVERVATGVSPSAQQELLLRTRSGRPLWIEARMRVVRRGGNAVAIEGAARDVTARRIAETKSTVQRGVARAVAESGSLESAYRGILETLCCTLHWDYGEIWWVDETYDVLRAAESWRNDAGDLQDGADERRRRTLGKGVGFPGVVWSTGEIQDVADVSREDDHWIQTLPTQPSLRRGLGVPVLRGGRALGVLVLLSGRMRGSPWSPREVLLAASDEIASLAERERTRDALRLSEARKHAMLESALDCVITVDHEGRLLEFNPASERTFGFARGDVLGQQLIDLIVPEELRGRAKEAFRTSQERPEPPFGGRRVEFEALRQDGSRFPVELSVARILVRQHPIFTAYLRDVTDRKDIDRLKDELVSTVSHELRTPLASVRGFVELLLTREYSPEETRECLEVVDHEIKRLSKLIDDFLDIQRLEARGLEYNFEVLDLCELLEEAVALGGGGTTRHEFFTDFGTKPLLVRVDPDRIRQVLRNLLSNAVKYSPDGGAVTVRAASDATSVTVSVVDTGIGMDEDTQRRLFRKFYRADNTMARRIGGTGLGLALVREIVTAHGGEIRVRSALGRGSEFSVVLPAGDGADTLVDKPGVDPT